MTICVLCFHLIFPPISLDPLVFFFRDIGRAVLQSNRRLWYVGIRLRPALKLMIYFKIQIPGQP